MKRGMLSLIVVLLSLTVSASAQVKQVSVAAGGVLWLSCAYRLEKAIQRLDGVASVKVQMAPVRAEITPRAGGWLVPDRLRDAVKRAGFKPGDIQYTVAGRLTEMRDQPVLSLPGSDRPILLLVDPKSPDAYQQARQAFGDTAGKNVEVQGLWVDRASPSEPASPSGLRLRSLSFQP